MRYRKRYMKEEKSPERIELEKLIREHVRLSKMSQTAIINTLCRHGVDSIRKLVVITELELYKMGKLGVVRVTALMDLKRYLEEERELYRTHDETLAKVKELLDQGYMTDEYLTPDYFRWLYTAFTRATKTLYLVNYPKEQVE